MRITFVNTPFYRLLGSHYNGMSLGMSYIAAYLNAHGHDAWIYNADYEPNPQRIISMEAIFDGFSNYKDVMAQDDHPLWKQVAQTALSKDPQVVGFHMYTANVKSCQLIAHNIKKINPDVKIFVGGDHATLAFENLLKDFPVFDYAIKREGEIPVLKLAEGVPLKDIPGLQYRDDAGNVCFGPESEFIEDLNVLPFPERHKYIGGTEYLDISYLMTGRGCPYACTYCASPSKWTRRATRFRSPENVCAEIEEVISIWGRTHEHYDYSFLSSNAEKKHTQMKTDEGIVYFVDDTFTMNRKRVTELLQMMIDRKYDIKWKCDTRADCVDEHRAELMQEAGCVRAKIGVETGSERMLKIIRKGESKDDIRKGVKLLKDHGIPVTVYLMAGFPQETDDDLKETIDFAYELDAEWYSLSVLAPYYGTQIFAEIQEEQSVDLDLEHWEYFYHQSGEMILNNHIKKETMEAFLALNKRQEKAYV